MAGFGDKFLSHLAANAQATTEELAQLAGVTPEQAYSRLMALSYEKRMVSAGKGKNRVWSLPGGKPVALAAPVKVAAVGNKSHGWKPDLSRYEALTGPVKKGEKLLVEYPEDWRHSMLCSVTRPDGYFDENGLAQVWNLRDDCFSLVDWANYAERGWKVVRIKGEKDLLRLKSDG
jgi:hypothetical protein